MFGRKRKIVAEPEPEPGIINTIPELVEQVISRITYKPGWNLVVLPCHKTEHVEAHLTFWAISAEDPAYDVEIIVTSQWPLGETYGRYWELAKNLFQHAELHELDEWLKADGVCLDNPHAEGTSSCSYVVVKCTYN